MDQNEATFFHLLYYNNNVCAVRVLEWGEAGCVVTELVREKVVPGWDLQVRSPTRQGSRTLFPRLLDVLTPLSDAACVCLSPAA